MWVIPVGNKLPTWSLASWSFERLRTTGTRHRKSRSRFKILWSVPEQHGGLVGETRYTPATRDFFISDRRLPVSEFPAKASSLLLGSWEWSSLYLIQLFFALYRYVRLRNQWGVARKDMRVVISGNRSLWLLSRSCKHFDPLFG
jgi:hypothetical protein